MEAEVFKTRKQLFLRVPTFKERWYFRLRADNGEIIAQSEAYNDKESVMKTLKRYFPDAKVSDLT